MFSPLHSHITTAAETGCVLASSTMRGAIDGNAALAGRMKR